MPNEVRVRNSVGAGMHEHRAADMIDPSIIGATFVLLLVALVGLAMVWSAWR
jgi:hypothetical protein